MLSGEPVRISVGANPEDWIPSMPPLPAVFLIRGREGRPYLGRTASIRRRLQRLLREQEGHSRWLNLRDVAETVEYWLTGSRLESALVSWEIARREFPDSYVSLLRLRLPPYVKLILTNEFPRTVVTRKLSSARAVFYGPFPSRPAAERFQHDFLELFQIRQCTENLEPSPNHPGCIYGEMNRCLRPCQQVVGPSEYASEVERVRHFLATDGESLVSSIAAARDRASEELRFEDAAREHARLERVRQVLRTSDPLARDIDRLHGVAVTRSAESRAVELWFLLSGRWAASRRLPLEPTDGRPISLDKRIRELAAGLEPPFTTLRERQEHLALLARWHNSSWRDGEWLPFEDAGAIPYRKLVNAIHRVAAGQANEN